MELHMHQNCDFVFLFFLSIYSWYSACPFFLGHTTHYHVSWCYKLNLILINNSFNLEQITTDYGKLKLQVFKLNMRQELGNAFSAHCHCPFHYFIQAVCLKWLYIKLTILAQLFIFVCKILIMHGYVQKGGDRDIPSICCGCFHKHLF